MGAVYTQLAITEQRKIERWRHPKVLVDEMARVSARIMALRFLFGKTCGREEMKKYMQFRTQPRKLPTVLSIEDVSELLAAATGPGLKHRAALSIGANHDSPFDDKPTARSRPRRR